MLNCELKLVDKKSDEFKVRCFKHIGKKFHRLNILNFLKVIETYTKETGGGWRVPQILEVWKVSRNDEVIFRIKNVGKIIKYFVKKQIIHKFMYSFYKIFNLI